MGETSDLYKWGQALAVLEASIPGGLSPETRVLAVERPLPYLGQLRAKAKPSEENQERLIEILGTVKELPEQLSNEAQGDVWLGYYSLTSKLKHTPRA